MKLKISTLLTLILLSGNSAFAFPTTLLNCKFVLGQFRSKGEVVTITVSKEEGPESPRDFGEIFAVASSNLSEFKFELISNLSERFGRGYSRSLYYIRGHNFALTQEAYTNNFWFSGILFGEKINQEISCERADPFNI